jgi:anthranilate synthase component 1
VRACAIARKTDNILKPAPINPGRVFYFLVDGKKMNYTIRTYSQQLLADTLTPVNIYLKLRDVFAGSILLESSDYHGDENSVSYICCDPLASFSIVAEEIRIQYPDGAEEKQLIRERDQVLASLIDFVNKFRPDQPDGKYAHTGLFGYTNYDAVRYFESVTGQRPEAGIPDLLYKLYRYVIVVNHFSNEMMLFQHEVADQDSQLERIRQILISNRFSTYSFQRIGEERCFSTDAEFLQQVEQGKRHCYRGDVFQIVLSRRFACDFRGDEFNVYRALRSINPSPYLFFFDYGGFKLMGSSPEAQLQVKNGSGYIYPIAGTFRRTGNDQEDAALANQLARDEKENAEHVMLVDLARNDMSRYANEVKVDVFKEIQFYSHVIHLVSKVTGRLHPDVSSLQLAAATFPAGTLSGAPKHKAMQLISQLEPVPRGFYGGAIGFIGLDGSYNHAIMIRTFMSRANQLIYQAGAGIVSKSDPAAELQEVNNKLGALRKALDMATTI